jgi:hypothetical protein
VFNNLFDELQSRGYSARRFVDNCLDCDVDKDVLSHARERNGEAFILGVNSSLDYRQVCELRDLIGHAITLLRPAPPPSSSLMPETKIEIETETETGQLRSLFVGVNLSDRIIEVRRKIEVAARRLELAVSEHDAAFSRMKQAEEALQPYNERREQWRKQWFEARRADDMDRQHDLQSLEIEQEKQIAALRKQYMIRVNERSRAFRKERDVRREVDALLAQLREELASLESQQRAELYQHKSVPSQSEQSLDFASVLERLEFGQLKELVDEWVASRVPPFVPSESPGLPETRGTGLSLVSVAAEDQLLAYTLYYLSVDRARVLEKAEEAIQRASQPPPRRGLKGRGPPRPLTGVYPPTHVHSPEDMNRVGEFLFGARDSPAKKLVFFDADDSEVEWMHKYFFPLVVWTGDYDEEFSQFDALVISALREEPTSMRAYGALLVYAARTWLVYQGEASKDRVMQRFFSQ